MSKATTGAEQVANILNDIEKAEVQRFVDNPTMREAVRKVLLKGIFFEGVLHPGVEADPSRNFLLALGNSADIVPNEQLGQTVRSVLEAVRMVETSWNYLEQYKTEPIKKSGDKTNPGR